MGRTPKMDSVSSAMPPRLMRVAPAGPVTDMSTAPVMPVPTLSSDWLCLRQASCTSIVGGRVRPLVWFTSCTQTNCSGFGNGNGRKTMECRTLKIALVAPMPSARVSTAASVKPGLFRSSLAPLRKSIRKSASHVPTEADLIVMDTAAEVAEHAAPGGGR